MSKPIIAERVAIALQHLFHCNPVKIQERKLFFWDSICKAHNFHDHDCGRCCQGQWVEFDAAKHGGHYWAWEELPTPTEAIKPPAGFVDSKPAGYISKGSGA